MPTIFEKPVSGMPSDDTRRLVLVTGGCGYIGTILVGRLLSCGYRVRVLDSMVFGNNLPPQCLSSPRLTVIQGDIRDVTTLSKAVTGVDAVVHLAAVANDPSADIDPAVTRSINYDAVLTLIDLAEAMGIRRLVNASSATVYGLRSEPQVTEDLPHNPISLYGHYKSTTDKIISARASESFETVNLRSATVCGWSPRMRLDLTVNLLTAAALTQGRITVHGGGQVRPNITVRDLARAYQTVLEAPAEIVNGKAYNICALNEPVSVIAERVRRVLNRDIEIRVEPLIDARSYRLCADLAEREIGFRPAETIDAAIQEVATAYRNGLIPDVDSPVYRNVAQMQAVGVQ